MKQMPTSWYAVPEEIKSLLVLAADRWEEPSVSDRYVNQALAKAGDNFDVLVSAYRYFFYRKSDRLALQVAQQAMEQVQRLEGLPQDWENLQPVLSARKEESNIRLYLNAYAASGLLLARMGELETAKEVASRVMQVDDRNEFGASVVFNILTQPPEDDDD
ncbi:hypothetical protein HC928_13535 [bacterium]|nr:hypothetical protein [bacterium]